MRNKTISLCDKSFEVARKMPNFSGWIREQLLKYQPVTATTNAERPKAPLNYMCKNCLGNHWTVDCPQLEVKQ